VPRGSSGPPTAAAVDLGSTSVHLLVARIVDHRVEPQLDESSFLGLGEAVEGRGLLGAEGREALVDALAHYAWTAREAGAESITFVATEPLRRLADAARVVGEVGEGTGVPLHVLEHDEEAFLTLIGVTEGRPVDEEVLVVDVGGGSTELVSIGPDRRAQAAGIRVGASRLTSRLVQHDPPTATELDALRAAVRDAFGEGPPAHPAEVIAVGGTASNLARILAEGDEAKRRLDRAELAAAFRVVGGAPADEVAAAHGVRPARARILAAGAAVLEAVVERYRVDGIRISEGGIREGTVLAVTHAGPAWRDRLEQLAHGWVDD
jgi:exopolyphosphatase/guanosine-5'-triphosphate,3'-diphosphate pyrophosphatase